MEFRRIEMRHGAVSRFLVSGLILREFDGKFENLAEATIRKKIVTVLGY